MIETICNFLDYIEAKSVIAVAFVVLGSGILLLILALTIAYILIQISGWLLLLIPLTIWLGTLGYYIYKFWKGNK